MSNLNEIYINLFSNTQFMSTQLRIILTILIIFDNVFNNYELKKIMLIFYIPSIMACLVTFWGLVAFFLQQKYGYFKKKILLLEEDKENIIYYIIGFLYKIILLYYIIKFNKIKLTNDIIMETFIYMSVYYFLFNVRKTYKTYLYQDIIVILLTISFFKRCEYLRL